jgi:hypothetical protein
MQMKCYKTMAVSTGLCESWMMTEHDKNRIQVSEMSPETCWNGELLENL